MRFSRSNITIVIFFYFIGFIFTCDPERTVKQKFVSRPIESFNDEFGRVEREDDVTTFQSGQDFLHRSFH